MRSLLMVAALVGLGACVAGEASPEADVGSGWRTAAGASLSTGEVDALSRSCTVQPHVTPIDTDRPVPDPLRDNPAYHPGGEGLANAPFIGIAASDRPIEPGIRRIGGPGTALVEQCLVDKGLVRAQ